MPPPVKVMNTDKNQGQTILYRLYMRLFSLSIYSPFQIAELYTFFVFFSLIFNNINEFFMIFSTYSSFHFF